MRSIGNSPLSRISTIILLLFSQNVFAQEANAGAESANSMIYWILGGTLVLLIAFAIYLLYSAISVLHQNGKSVDFKFTLLRDFTQNSRAVGILLFILVLAGIIWAISSKA